MSAPAIRAAFVPVYHYGAGVAPKRTAWLVEFGPEGSDERLRCCESTHGHRTQDAAKLCFGRALKRYRKVAR